MTSSLFPPETVAVMRQMREGNMPFTAKIQTMTEGTEDEDGAASITRTVAWAGPAAYEPLQGNEVLTADQLAAGATGYVVLPAGTPIDATQEIELAGGVGCEGVGLPFTMRLAVIAPPEVPRTTEIVRRVLCSTIRS